MFAKNPLFDKQNVVIFTNVSPMEKFRRSRCLDHWKRAVWDRLGFHLPSHGEFSKGGFFFSAEEVRPSGPQNFRLELFLLTLLWGQCLSSFRIVPLCGTQIISFSATATNVLFLFVLDSEMSEPGQLVLSKVFFFLDTKESYFPENIVLE